MDSLVSHRTVYESFDYKDRTFLSAGPGIFLMNGRVLISGAKIQVYPYGHEAEKEVHVQAFVEEATIEAFDETIFGRPPRPNEIQFYPGLVSPGVHGAAAKLCAVVHGDRHRQAPGRGQPLEAEDDLLAGERDIRPQQQAFPGKLVDQGQDPEVTAVLQTFR